MHALKADSQMANGDDHNDGPTEQRVESAWASITGQAWPLPLPMSSLKTNSDGCQAIVISEATRNAAAANDGHNHYELRLGCNRSRHRTPTHGCRCRCQVIRHGMWHRIESKSKSVRSGPAAVPFACKLEQAGKTHAADSADKRIWHAPAKIVAEAAEAAAAAPGASADPKADFHKLPSYCSLCSSTFKFKDKWARIRFDLLLIYNLENLLNSPRIEKNEIVDGPTRWQFVVAISFRIQFRIIAGQPSTVRQ